MMTSSDVPVFPSSVEIEAKQKTEPTSYEKMYSKSFIDSTEQLFVKASNNFDEKLIAKDELNDLFQTIRKVPLYERDEKALSVKILQNEIRTLHSNFQRQNT